jgi:hypothetical protein
MAAPRQIKLASLSLQRGQHACAVFNDGEFVKVLRARDS